MNFILFSYGRSGSTYVKQWLNKHPVVVCMGEKLRYSSRKMSLSWFLGSRRGVVQQWSFRLFYKYPRLGSLPVFFFQRTLNRYMEFLEQEKHTSPLKIKNGLVFSDFPVQGMKVMYSQLLLFWPLRKRLFCYKVIHLLRRNVLAIYVSALVGEEQGIYHSRKILQLEPVHIPLSGLIWKLNKIRWQQRYFSSKLRNADCLTIFYEDLFSVNQSRVQGSILDFLGVDKLKLEQPDLIKLGSKELRKRIKNYNEVAARLRGTKFADCLDEE